MNTDYTSQIRCIKCDRLLAKNNDEKFEIKCERCGTLNKIFERMIEQVIITDPDGKILFLNKSLEKTTGFTLGESIGKVASQLWGGNMSKDFYIELWINIKIKKESIKVKMTNKKKSGELYDIELIISPILNTKGEVVFFVGIEVVV